MADSEDRHYSAVQVLYAIEEWCKDVNEPMAREVARYVDIWKGEAKPGPHEIECLNAASKKIRAQIRESDTRKN